MGREHGSVGQNPGLVGFCDEIQGVRIHDAWGLGCLRSIPARLARWPYRRSPIPQPTTHESSPEFGSSRREVYPQTMISGGYRKKTPEGGTQGFPREIQQLFCGPARRKRGGFGGQRCGDGECDHGGTLALFCCRSQPRNARRISSCDGNAGCPRRSRGQSIRGTKPISCGSARLHC